MATMIAAPTVEDEAAKLGMTPQVQGYALTMAIDIENGNYPDDFLDSWNATMSARELFRRNGLEYTHIGTPILALKTQVNRWLNDLKK